MKRPAIWKRGRWDGRELNMALKKRHGVVARDISWWLILLNDGFHSSFHVGIAQKKWPQKVDSRSVKWSRYVKIFVGPLVPQWHEPCPFLLAKIPTKFLMQFQFRTGQSQSLLINPYFCRVNPRLSASDPIFAFQMHILPHRNICTQTIQLRLPAVQGPDRQAATTFAACAVLTASRPGHPWHPWVRACSTLFIFTKAHLRFRSSQFPADVMRWLDPRAPDVRCHQQKLLGFGVQRFVPVSWDPISHG